MESDDADCEDAGESSVDTDCDDTEDEVHPDAWEICNGVDDDCDPDTDEEVDGDGDGLSVCDGDCDDGDEAVHPGAWEACDGQDTDCDPDTIEDPSDADEDGHRVCDGDCDDDNDTVYPDAPELCDGLDNDCDGEPEGEDDFDFVQWYEDADGDGFGSEASAVTDCAQPDGYVAEPGDCDDADPEAWPGAVEVCDDGLVDQDCDGREFHDEDSDTDVDDPDCWPEGCACSATASGSAGLGLGLCLLLLAGRRRRRSRPLAGILLAGTFALATLTPSPAAAQEEEATRQADFARQELADGQYDQALKSAESALRLQPTLYEAMLLKALAYEGLGNLELAESLVRAYVELAGPSAETPEVTVHLERITAARQQRVERGRHRTARERATERVQVEEGTVEVAAIPPDDLDPGPYEERVVAALSGGRCAAARAAAAELTLAAPDRSEGWKLAGDAARCAARTREAVLGYRKYEQLGGKDRAVLRLLGTLAESLATVRVQLASDQELTPPKLVLHAGAEQVRPEAKRNRVFLFRDLDVEQEMTLEVYGRGYERLTVDVPLLGAGDEHRVTVEPTYLGTGTVAVLEHAPEAGRTTLFTPDETLQAEPLGEYEVTAGETLVRVEGEHGSVDPTLTVTRDERVELDPTLFLPSALTLIEVPAGASYRLSVEGAAELFVERADEIPPDGDIDHETGVRLTSLQLDSLPGGGAGLFVEHPVLGRNAETLALQAGAVNAWTFDWRSMEGVATVQGAYDDWKATRARTERLRTTRTALGIASGIGLATGVALLASSAGASQQMTDARAEGSEAAAGSDELVDAWKLSRRASGERTGLLVAGGVTAAVGLAGVTVTLVFPKVAKGWDSEVGEWDPAAVGVGEEAEQEPQAEPAEEAELETEPADEAEAPAEEADDEREEAQ